jgi:diguanylate cyclase (GGDEF)-like protein
MKELKEMLNQLKVFEKMYNIMRIVDPVEKKVLEYTGEELREESLPCYEFWKQQDMCENCISMRAYLKDDTYVKIESKSDSLYMITAVPITVNNKKLVVELVKNVTNIIYIENEQNAMGNEIYNLIKRMNNAAVKDALTESYNRRYINERLPVEIINASIHQVPLSVIFTDLDHFKNVNDTFGHTAGDMVLKKTVKAMSGCIHKENDWIARYGGEEFLLCLPGADNDAAVKIAERLRKRIERKEFTFQGRTIRITASFGVHTIDPDEKLYSMEELIALVDHRLYEAKRTGRNEVVYR